jgi:hypothetical protein
LLILVQGVGFEPATDGFHRHRFWFFAASPPFSFLWGLQVSSKTQRLTGDLTNEQRSKRRNKVRVTARCPHKTVNSNTFKMPQVWRYRLKQRWIRGEASWTVSTISLQNMRLSVPHLEGRTISGGAKEEKTGKGNEVSDANSRAMPSMWFKTHMEKRAHKGALCAKAPALFLPRVRIALLKVLAKHFSFLFSSGGVVR